MSHKKVSHSVSGFLAEENPLDDTRSLMDLIRTGQSALAAVWIEEEAARIRDAVAGRRGWTPPGVRPKGSNNAPVDADSPT